MDANSEVEKLIPLFLGIDMYNLPAMVMATEEVIKNNHLQIIEFLELHNVDPEILSALKNHLKL